MLTKTFSSTHFRSLQRFAAYNIIKIAPKPIAYIDVYYNRIICTLREPFSPTDCVYNSQGDGRGTAVQGEKKSRGSEMYGFNFPPSRQVSPPCYSTFSL